MNLKTFVLITAIIELLAGVGLFLAPQLMPPMADQGPMAFTLARMYGAAAIAIGYYALMVWRHYNPGPIQGFLKTFLVFHVGVTAAALYGYNQGVAEFLPVVALHAIMAGLTIYYTIAKR